MNIETRTIEFAGLETRDGENGDRHIVGLVSPFESQFDTGKYVETFSSSTFDKSIQERGDRIPLLEQHDNTRHPIGMAVKWDKTAAGLIADFKLAPTPRGEEAHTLAREGIVTGLSVGFVPIRNKTTTVGRRTHIQRLEARLDHVGLVTTAAYQEAKVLAVRSYDPDDDELVPRLAKWRHLLLNT